jgi:hypothetical protein
MTPEQVGALSALVAALDSTGKSLGHTVDAARGCFAAGCDGQDVKDLIKETELFGLHELLDGLGS